MGEDIECLRATRALLTSSLTNQDEDATDGPTSLVAGLVRRFGAPAAVVMLAYLADQLGWSLARHTQTDGWTVLSQAVEVRRERFADVEAFAAPQGPLPEFAALGHAYHTLSNETRHRWAAGLVEEHGEWVIAAGVQLVNQLLEDVGVPLRMTPLDALRDLSLRHEALWGDGGGTPIPA